MKNITNLLWVFLFGTTVLNAQIQLEALENGIDLKDNTYYKDINNVLDGFEGTYEHNGADFYFKIKLVKRTMKSVSSNYCYWDMLEGTYRYTKNGVDANYLNDIFDDSNARIDATSIRKAEDTFCEEEDDCLPEKWLKGSISDRINKRTAGLFIAKRIVNGEEGLQLWFHYEWSSKGYQNAAHLPSGEFFVKKIAD